MDLKKYIVDIQDFPIEGVIFRDVTPLLKDKDAYKILLWDLRQEVFYLVVRLPMV